MMNVFVALAGVEGGGSPILPVRAAKPSYERTRSAVRFNDRRELSGRLSTGGRARRLTTPRG